MQRRAIQLSVVFVAVFAVAMPSRAEQADATMGVGLRIVASERTTAGPDATGNRNQPGADDSAVLAHGRCSPTASVPGSSARMTPPGGLSTW